MNARVIFGSTGLSVSPVCFGTWQLSPRFWGDQPKDEMLRAMDTAFAGGINFFDTADAYGDGLSETVLGEFIAGKPRDELVICTKVFNHFNPDASRYPDLSAAHVRERCDMQLQRLGIDCIDLYLLHFYDQLTPLAEIAGTLEGLKAAGKIKHYGVSNHTVEQLRAQRCFGSYAAVQPPYSLLAPQIENDLLPYCQAENIGVMVYSPMHKGLLSGKYRETDRFTDFRQHHPDFQGERFRQVTAAVQELQPIAAAYGLSIYQLVLVATLMHPGIQVAVAGIKTAAQIAEAIGAMGVEISREDYFKVRQILTIEAVTKIKDAKAGTR